MASEKKLEEVRDFYNSCAAYENGLQMLARDLKGVRKLLQDTQKNPTANFYDDGTEGSKEYQAMAAALSNAINKLEDKNASPLEIKQSFKDLMDASNHYHQEKNKLVILASNESGQARYATSEAIAKNVPNMVNIFDNLRKPLDNGIGKDKTQYSTKSLAEIKAKAENSVTKYAEDLGPEKEWKVKPDFKDVSKTSKIQLSFIKKIKGISKTLGTTYNPTKDFDYYLTAKKKMTMEDTAKYFLGKKYIDKIFAPGISSAAAKNLADGFKASDFKKQYTALAKNPYFIQCIKDNPKTGLSKWNELETQTDLTIKAFQAEHMDLGLERLAPGIINQNIGNMSGPFGKPSPERMKRRQDEIITKMADAMTLDMLIDPSMRNLAREITQHPENRERLNEAIKSHLEAQNIFASERVDKATIKAAELMTNPESRKQLANNFLRTVNMERQAEREQAAKTAKHASKKATGMHV
ncbi:hypothetical protein SAMN02910369_00725 [Lachnospiraceae bacterium NE2001]|nr:hypothetical protein SAMN02910369_00725 [Lachnospiraceae bacterium NE2001]